MRLARYKTLLVSLLAILWVSAMLMAFWWYQARYIRPFSEQTALFSGTPLRLPAALAGPGLIRVVHFWDPACPCNVGNQQHLTELLARFGPQDVKFYAVQKPGSRGQLPSTLQDMETLEPLPGSEQLPASPAVAIWDREGRLAYFGPYSEGAVCNSGNSFVEPILEALQQNRRVTATHTLAVGCFCTWNEASPAP